MGYVGIAIDVHGKGIRGSHTTDNSALMAPFMADRAMLRRRVLAGESGAYALIVERYYDRYARFAVHMVGNREDAEEALQDAFLRAFRALDRYEERERFGGWLLRIVVNECRTVSARRRRRFFGPRFHFCRDRRLPPGGFGLFSD